MADLAKNNFRILRAAARWLGRGLLTLVVLLLLVFGFLQTRWGKDLVRDQVVSLLADTFQGRVEFDRLEGFLPFSVTVKGVRILDPDGVLVVAVPELQARFHPWALTESTVHLSDVVVTRPEVTLLDAAGRVALGRAFLPKVASPPSPDPSPWVIRFEGLRLDDGRLDEIVLDDDLALSALTVDLRLSFGPTGIAWPHLQVGADVLGQSELARLIGPALAVTTRGALAGELLTLEEVTVAAGPHELRLHGGVSLGPEPAGELVLDALAVALDALPERLRVALAGGSTAPLGVLSGQGQARLGADGEGVFGLELTSALGKVSVDGGARFVEGAAGRALGDWKVALGILDGRAPPSVAAGQGVIDGAQLHADVNIEGHSNPLSDNGKLSLSGDLRLRNASGEKVGHAVVAGRRLGAEPGAAPRFELTTAVDALPLGPWLALVGEPELRGSVRALNVQAEVVVPAGEQPLEVTATGTLDVSVHGRVAALGEQVDAEPLKGTVEARWVAGGTPSGRLKLEGSALGLGEARVGSLTVDVNVEPSSRDNHIDIKGKIEAKVNQFADGMVEALSVPFGLELELRAGALPTGTLGVHAVGVTLPERLELGGAAAPGQVKQLDTELVLSRVGSGLGVRGAVQVEGVALVVGGEALGLGRADLQIDAKTKGIPDAPWGGAVQAVLSGGLTGVRAGARRVERLGLDGLSVALARDGAGGFTTAQVRGGVSARGVRAPEAVAEALKVKLNLDVGLAPLAVRGEAEVQAEKAGQPGGPQLDAVRLVARGDGRTITFEGEGDQAFAPLDGQEGAADRLALGFSGAVTLPRGRKPIAVDVGRVEVRRQSDGVVVLGLNGARYQADGWVVLDQVAVEPTATSHGLVVGGRFHPRDGVMDLSVDGSGLELRGWYGYLRRLLRWLGLAPLPARQIAGSAEVHAVLGGSFTKPEASVKVQIKEFAWESASGANMSLEIAVTPAEVRGRVALGWHAGSSLGAEVALPVALTVSPFRWAWQKTEPLRMHVAVSEPDLGRALGWVEALTGEAPPEVAGAVDWDLVIDGTAEDPRLDTTLVLRPISMGGGRAGALWFRGGAQAGASQFALRLEDAAGALVGQVRAELPLSMPAALWKDEPIAWMKGEVTKSPFAVSVNIPRVVIDETPLGPLVPGEWAAWDVEADLGLSGTLGAPQLNGHALVAPSQGSDLDLAARVDFRPRGALTDLNLRVTRAQAEPLAEGLITLPGLGRMLLDPASALKIVRDDELSLELATSEIATLDVWELHEGLGALASQLFPDGRVMASVSARGGAEGMRASVVTRVRTVLRSRTEADSARNLADLMTVRVGVAPDKTSVSAVLLQEAVGAAPALTVDGSLAVGSRGLLEGSERPLEEAPILLKLLGNRFQLGGLAAAYRAVLGASQGYVDGQLQVAGTLTKPQFSDALSIHFQPISIAPLGILHDSLTLTIDFPEPTRYRVTATPLIDPTRETERGKPTRCSIGLPAEPAEDAHRPFLVLGLTGAIPALDTAQITLDGCIGLRDYGVLAKHDMRARVDGELRLGGTVDHAEIKGQVEVVEGLLAPAMANKSVRPVGPPLDVTLMRGPPRPVASKAPKNPFATSLTLAVKVRMTPNKLRLEPSLMQPFGEVRAVLFPDGELDVRTIDGEISVVGTVRVPKESVYLYGKMFTVDADSRLVFLGDLSSDPQLFFTARYNIAHVDLSSIGLATTADSEIVVRVTGTPTAPVLDFSSTPAMDEANILSVIALGAPAGGGEAFDDATSQLLTAVMGMATLQFARDFQQRLALDVLKIEARSADPSDTRLTVGKRLANNLTVNYYLNLAASRADEDVNAGSIEYRITPFLSVLARAGDAGDFRLELNLSFRDTTPKKVKRAPARGRFRPRQRLEEGGKLEKDQKLLRDPREEKPPLGPLNESPQEPTGAP